MNPYYVTGFVDGEGSFIITVNPHSGYNTGYRIKATFAIGLHEKDLPLLELIRLFFGVGSITRLGTNTFQYRVTKIEDLEIILAHFYKYPLLTKKQADFLLFKEVINLLKLKEHLSMEGLKKILSLKASARVADLCTPRRRGASINLGLSDQLNKAFPDVIPVLRPRLESPPLIQDLNWFVGFTDAEGCFFVSIRKSVNSKLGEAVSLRFVLTQHLRDEELIKSFITVLGCGRYIPCSSKDCGEYVVERFADITQKILPIFAKNQLNGVKRLDLQDFKKIVTIMENRDHLTLSGLNEIKKIKSNMNTQRTHNL